MSMQPVVFKVALFRGDFDQARSQYSLLWMMEALVRINQSHIRQFRKLTQEKRVPAPYPLIYRSGVHYEPEAGTEEWVDIPNILDVHGGTFPGSWADCEDLACWRVAELREDPHHPIKAKPFAKWRRKDDGSYAYHALCLLPGGQIEDPSLVLGMGNEPEFARLHMAERYKEGSLTPSIRFAKTPDVIVVDPSKPSGFAGKKDIPMAKAATGLLPNYVDRPPPGAKITSGLVTGTITKGSAIDFPIQGRMPRSDEDGSIYSNVQGVDNPAWGYDRHRMTPIEAKTLRSGGQFVRVPGKRNSWAVSPLKRRMITG